MQTQQSDSAVMIAQAVRTAGQNGYTGTFRALGGGEINDTYLLEFEGGKRLVLRIARYADQTSLATEADVLRMLNLNGVPKLVFFDSQNRIDGRAWILESYVDGRSVERLSVDQFGSLGTLLGQVHQSKTTGARIDVWRHFLDACKSFGDEQKLLAHADPDLQWLINSGRRYAQERQTLLEGVVPSCIHGDATPSNILVRGNYVALIDWEFSTFADPMAEFSTIYYDDMEYNRGKWRVHITPEERSALFNGYETAGGKIDVGRIALWMTLDKLGAAVYLYWRMHESGRPVDAKQESQYRLDLDTLKESLSKTLD